MKSNIYLINNETHQVQLEGQVLVPVSCLNIRNRSNRRGNMKYTMREIYEETRQVPIHFILHLFIFSSVEATSHMNYSYTQIDTDLIQFVNG